MTLGTPEQPATRSEHTCDSSGQPSSPSFSRLTFVISGLGQTTSAKPLDGQAIFRYDTFGDEQLWTDVLRMHEVIPSVSPATALAVGLKVDVQALPPAVIAALQDWPSRSEQPRCHGRTVTTQRGRRRSRQASTIRDS